MKKPGLCRLGAGFVDYWCFGGMFMEGGSLLGGGYCNSFGRRDSLGRFTGLLWSGRCFYLILFDLDDLAILEHSHISGCGVDDHHPRHRKFHASIVFPVKGRGENFQFIR